MTSPLDRGHAWLLLSPDAAPERWRRRAVPVLLVPLEPGEAGRVLPAGDPPLADDEDRLARLVARGLAPSRIARELGVPLRTVYRRLAVLRDRFEVGSTAELGTELARRGL